MKSVLKSSLTCLAVLIMANIAQAETPCKSILEIATSTPGLSTLVTAVKAAGLVDSLSGPGPFTVFAPLNQAFAKIPGDQLQALLGDRLKLRSVLFAHIVIGQELTFDNLKGRDFENNSVSMANGSKKIPRLEDNGYTFDGANYVANDIQACNGIVQLIDTVLAP